MKTFLTWIARSTMLLLLCLNVRAQTSPETTALIMITNATKITNAQSSFTVNGVTRTWTNIVTFAPTTSIAFTNDGFQATTNLLQAYQRYSALGSSGAPVSARTNATNAIKLVSALNDTLTVTFTPGYCTVTYSTNYYTNATPYRSPFTSEPNQTRSNIISGMVEQLNMYPTNLIAEGAPAFSNYPSLTFTQRVSNKIATNTTIQGGSISNASISLLTLNNVGAWSNSIIFLNAGTYGPRIYANGNGYASLGTWGGPVGGLASIDDADTILNWGMAKAVLPQLSATPNITNIWSTSNTFSGVVIFRTGFVGTNTQQYGGYLTNMRGSNLKLTNTMEIGVTNPSAWTLGVPGSLGAQLLTLDSTGLNIDAGNFGDTSATLNIGGNEVLNYDPVLRHLYIGNGSQITNVQIGLSTVFSITDLIGFLLGGNTTNSGWLNVAGPQTNYNGLNVLGGTLRTFSMLASNVAIQNFSTTNGIHTGTNNWNGDMALQSRTFAGLVNGNNTAILLGTNVVVELSGATTIATICSFGLEREGAWHKVRLSGAITNTIANESGGESVDATRRITTGTGGDITLTNQPSWIEVRYKNNRWELLNWTR